MKREDLLLSAVVAVEGAHAFSAFMPSTFTTRELAANSESGLRSLRAGYAPAIAFNLLLAFAMAALLDSPMPIVFAAGTIVFMLGLYEWSIRGAQQNRDGA